MGHRKRHRAGSAAEAVAPSRRPSMRASVQRPADPPRPRKWLLALALVLLAAWIGFLLLMGLTGPWAIPH